MPSRVSRLNRQMTIREVSVLANWSYDRMKSHLLRLNRACGGRLLVPSVAPNRRFTLSLSALRRCAPDMFETIEDVSAQVEALLETTASIETKFDLIASQTGANTRDIAGLKSRRDMPRKEPCTPHASAPGPN